MAKVNHYGVIVCIIWCCMSLHSAAQTCHLIVYSEEQANMQALSIRDSFPNKSLCLQYVNSIPALLISTGYIGASVDSVWEDSTHIFIQLFRGEKYEWQKIIVETGEQEAITASGYQKEIFEKQVVTPDVISLLYQNVLAYYSNNGYPFASISFDSISINDEKKITAKLIIDAGPIYHIDSVVLEENNGISKKFIQQYLDIHDGDMYQQDKLDAINALLLQLSFLRQRQPWDISMINTGAILHIYPEPMRNNDINILIGLLPANQQTGGKVLLTGDARINLRNSFKTGETISLNWQQLQPRSPRLNLGYNQPYIFSAPFGLNVAFDLYKRDSAFLNIQSQAGLLYRLSAKQTGAVLIQTLRSSILSTDTATVRITKTLPPDIDMSMISLGVQYSFIGTNYRFNPRSGNELQLSVTFGTKKIKNNAAITQLKDPVFNYSSLYDSIQLNSYQFRLQANASHFFPVGKQSTLKLALNSGWYQSPDYFQNELFRIGGSRLLRGFDEESILTNLYGIGTLEYRYLLARNSFLFAFTDVGKVRFVNSATSYLTTYIGFGMGIVFETPTGIFNIAYAAGKHGYNAVDLRQSKIHLGFVSLF